MSETHGLSKRCGKGLTENGVTVFMRGLSKNKKILLVLLACTVVLAVLLFLILGGRSKPRKENGITQLSFSVGDKLAGYAVTDHEGNEVDIADVSDTAALYIFGMAGCRDCIADFPSYELIFSLYDSEDFSVVFIWDDEIPSSELEEMGIPSEASYSAKGRYKFTDWVPSYYLIGQDDVIVSQTAEVEEAAKLLGDYPVSAEGFEKAFQGMKVLVGIDRCKSCKDAYEKLLGQGDPFVYMLEGAETAEGEHQTADPNRILAEAFHIEDFPVCLYLDGSEEIVVDPDC